MRETYRDIYDFVAENAPEEPVHVVYSDILTKTASTVVRDFPGDVLYAVKCNNHPMVLQALYDGGVTHFDTASITEIELIQSLFPGAECHFMHPVKPSFAITRAYHEHGVKNFALDHIEELEKIDHCIADGDRSEILLAVRVEMPSGQTVMDLSGKFGAPLEEASTLLSEVYNRGYRTGLTFHVGSYCTNPGAYRTAISLCRRVQAMANVPLDVLDVGGGFPSCYTGTEGDFRDYVEEVSAAVDEFDFIGDVSLRCEPGRGLVGEGQSILVKVDLRRGQDLFLNDGVFGGLSELKYLGPYFPIQTVRLNEAATAQSIDGVCQQFQLFGPTCDNVDSCPGPFEINGAVRTGDWLEIGKMGAYSNAYRTHFNGFHSDRFIIVTEKPFWENVPIRQDNTETSGIREAA